MHLAADDAAATLLLSWSAAQTGIAPEPSTQPVKSTSNELATALSTLPLVEINGMKLPARLIALQLLSPAISAGKPVTTMDAPAFIQIPTLNSESVLSVLDTSISEVAAPEVSALPVSTTAAIFSARGQAELQANMEQLPTSPLFVLRQAKLRGHVIAVVALSPVFAQNGTIRVATHIQAQLDQVRLLTPQSVAAIMDAPVVQSANLVQPVDIATPLAQSAQTLWRLTVSQAGIQRVSGQMLADVGMSLTGVNPSYIHVRWQGTDVALDLHGLDDGVFDLADEIRFYAPEPGDRWNATDTYFLSTEQTVAPRMATRDVRAASAGIPLTLRNTAMQFGRWQNNTRYESRLPGSDGDHWFSSRLDTPTKNAGSSDLHIELTSTLPLVAGPVSITLFGATESVLQHAVSAHMGSSMGQSPADGSFQGAGNWVHSLTLSDNQPAVDIQLNSTGIDSYTLDYLTYARPVQLNFGGQSAHFWGVAGAWAYQLEGLPAQSAIYDVSDLAAPVVLTPVENGQIYDSAAGPRHYWVSGTNAVAQPVITPDSSARVTDVDRWGGISQIYIVPRALHNQLIPLLDFRQSQNQLVQAIDVELIYNTWSGGQISPTAIRQFVRYVVEQNPALKAITLVGDGSNDPRNFLGRSNPTLIPPYLAMVDPWLGETACDTCYAQIDGDDPVEDWLPDVLIGRLPVKSAAELTQLVNKIIAYETAPLDGWNWRSGHLADNYQDANGKPDTAGNFPAYEDAAVNLQPPTVDVRRAYYDPYLPTTTNSPWRVADPIQAHQNVLNLFNAGATIVNFQGHGYYDQLGQTAIVTTSPVSYLLHSSDVAQLTNGSKLPLVIEMACWTSAFQQPLDGAATIDELLVLAPNGGAIATWGSTGWGVAYQHEYLQKGVYAALWDTPQMDATVGDVVQNGLVSLFSEAACCLDALRTYTLLGDPMTVLHAVIPTRTWLPATLNQ